MDSEIFDYVIIGSGFGGSVSALRLVEKGHSVLVLDMARAPDGRRAVLLGQSYMPAQSYHVLRPAPQEAWFAVDPASDGIQTPFWPVPFPWTSIRRLD